MPRAEGLLLVVAACGLLAGAQAWFLPFGYEKQEPRARRTALAVASVLLLVIGITAAHALLPDHPTVASMIGAVAAVTAMKALRSLTASAGR